MENSEFHEKSTPRVMEKRKIVNFTHKIHFWYGKRACRQKLIKPMEY